MPGKYLMVKFSITSGKCSSSSLSSSKVMQPLLSESADSKRAIVRSLSFSSGKEMELSFRHDFKTVRSSSGSIEPLPAGKEDFGLTPDIMSCKRLLDFETNGSMLCSASDGVAANVPPVPALHPTVMVGQSRHLPEVSRNMFY